MDKFNEIVFISFLLISINSIQLKAQPKSIVLWHGMGDTCCFSGSLGYIKKHLEETIKGVYVKSLMIGKNEKEDFENSYFMNSNDQIEDACNQVKSDAQLKNGFNLLGFSQGSQFARALVQRCDNINVTNLITFGGQHQGVYGLPKCMGDNVSICNLVRRLLSYGAYEDFVQKHLVQAQYWHSPLEEDVYIEKSLFLADINNERIPRNNLYKQRLMNLTNFVMIKFDHDTMVQPKESELFGFYKINQTKDIETLQETTLYKEDWLGLKELDKQNRLKFITIPGEHLHFSLDWFDREILQKYLI